MSTPRSIPDDYTGEWNRARFQRLCRRHKLTTATSLRRFLLANLPDDAVPSQRTCDRIWNGETDPVHAGRPHGSRSLVLELADAFEVSPLWFLCADKGEASS